MAGFDYVRLPGLRSPTVRTWVHRSTHPPAVNAFSDVAVKREVFPFLRSRTFWCSGRHGFHETGPADWWLRDQLVGRQWWPVFAQLCAFEATRAGDGLTAGASVFAGDGSRSGPGSWKRSPSRLSRSGSFSPSFDFYRLSTVSRVAVRAGAERNWFTSSADAA